MIYLDTGCIVKLYYPEPDSLKVIAAIQGKRVCYSALHELEFVNALHLKVFFQGATTAQVTAARALVAADLQSAVLVRASGEWKDILQEAVKLAEQHNATLGCRSLDILHCAAAKVAGGSRIRQHRHAAKKAGRGDGVESGGYLTSG